MRKPRDFDAQLKALNEKARVLKESKLLRLGELVVASDADALDADTLAGALLGIAAARDKQLLSTWKKAGEEYFRKGKRTAAARAKEAGQVASEAARTSESPLAESDKK